MINPILSAINETLTGYTKTYCLLERSESNKTVQYSGGGSFNTIAFDSYNVGGYWRLRSNVAFAEAQGTIACSKKQTITYPLYFVAWFRRDDIEDSDQFAQLTAGTISGLRTPSVRTQVRGYAIDQQQTETGKINDSWMVIRFDVDVVFTKICPTTCATVEPFCKLLGSINDVLIGEFFSDFNIIVENNDGEPVGEWDGSKWVVPSGTDCQPATYTVRDQFGNDLADGSIASGDHSDIDLTIEQTCSKLVNGAVTTGAGTAAANGTWMWNEDEGQYENENGDRVIIEKSGGWDMRIDGIRVYLGTEAVNPWSAEWTVAGEGQAPAPTFTQATEPCTATFRIGNKTDGYATFPNLPADEVTTVAAKDSEGNDVPVEKVGNDLVIPSLPAPDVYPESAIPWRSSDFENEPAAVNECTLGLTFYDLDPNDPGLENYFPFYGSHLKRLTGVDGGYYDGGYKLLDGTPTDRDGAFPNGVVLDWGQACWSLNKVVMFTINPWGDGDYDTILADVESATIGGYTGWTIPNIRILYALSREYGNFVLGYEPFEISENITLWTSTRRTTNNNRTLGNVTGNIGSSSTFTSYPIIPMRWHNF